MSIHIKRERLVRDTLELVNISSVTGNTDDLAARYTEMLEEVGCKVEVFEFYPNNPTIVATYEGELPGKTIIFNGHMDVVPIPHTSAEVKDDRIYGRGSCDMKGSLACILEVIRQLNEIDTPFAGRIVVIANSLHESPGGRGEDLIALVEKMKIEADAAIVMEGATEECTIAQLGSATFEINISREGEPSHQLYTKEGTPHPISVAALVIQRLDMLNEQLKQHYIEDIGHASYFIGSVHSGQFYNQFPVEAHIVGVRRYAPNEIFENVEQQFISILDELASQTRTQIDLKLEKVRDGYRIDSQHPAVQTLVQAIEEVRGVKVPLVGKKVVTDAGILAQGWGIPVVCHGPEHLTAHGDLEHVKIIELEKTVAVYLKFVELFNE